MKIELNVTKRTLQGTGASRRLRREGRVPGILYGHSAAQAIELDHNDIFHKLRQEAFHSSVLTLKVDGDEQPALLRDVQMHAWKPQVLHVDFQRVDATEKIHMKVPLHFKNADIAPGVKTAGGIVTHILNEIDVLCLPKDLPEFIEVDLSTLQVGHSVHVNDLALPAGVEVSSSLKLGNGAVASVTLPRAAKAEEETVAAAPAVEEVKK